MSVYTHTHMFTYVCVYIRTPNIMSKSCTKRYLAHCRFSISQPSPVRRSVREILALLIELRSIAHVHGHVCTWKLRGNYA